MKINRTLTSSAWACKHWKSLDFLKELRERAARLTKAKKEVERAYVHLAEWITEGESQRTKFADVRELFKLHGLKDEDIFTALEKKLNAYTEH